MPTTILNQSKSGRLILAAAFTLLLMALTYFTMGIYQIHGLISFPFHADKNFIRKSAVLITYALTNILFFLSLFNRKTDRYRAVFFILVALMFPIGFITGLFELRGHLMVATFENMIRGEVPFCHIVIPQTLIPMLFNKTIIFPGTVPTLANFHYSAAMMIIVWAAVTIGLGSGWCSWTCFYGGWEDGFSRIGKKPLIRNLGAKLRYIPYAIFTAVVLLSLSLITPVYCMWLCPFKSVSEFIQVLSPVNIIQTIVFILLFVALVVVFPLLTKKRTQCAYFCPFGVMQKFFDKINFFDIRIDPDKCVQCGRCEKACPTFSIDGETINRRKAPTRQ